MNGWDYCVAIALGSWLGFLTAHMLLRRRLACMHHNPDGGWFPGQPNKATSYIETTSIDRRHKNYQCTICRKGWNI